MFKLVVYNVYSMSHFKVKINMMLIHADGPSEKNFIMRPIHVLVYVYRSRRNSGRILLIFKTQLTIKTDCSHNGNTQNCVCCLCRQKNNVCCDIKTLTTDNRQWLKATNATYCTWSLLDRTCEINRTYSFLPALFTGSTTHRQTVSEPACSKKLRSGLDVLPLTGDLNGNISASCWMSAPASLPVHWHTSR